MFDTGEQNRVGSKNRSAGAPTVTTARLVAQETNTVHTQGRSLAIHIHTPLAGPGSPAIYAASD